MKKIIMDCGAITTAEQFHTAIAQAMSFPDWYGGNLDALYDCLTDIDEQTELVLNGWHALQYRLKDYAEKILYTFRCVTEEYDTVIFTMHP